MVCLQLGRTIFPRHRSDCSDYIRNELSSAYVIPRCSRGVCSQSVQVRGDELVVGKKCNNKNPPPPILGKTLIIITILAFTFLFSVSMDVEFCGYTITHPSESKINFRIQTRGERQLFKSLSCHLLFLLLSFQISLCAQTCRQQVDTILVEKKLSTSFVTTVKRKKVLGTKK